MGEPWVAAGAGGLDGAAACATGKTTAKKPRIPASLLSMVVSLSNGHARAVVAEVGAIAARAALTLPEQWQRG